MNSINIKDKYYQEEKCGISKLYEEVKKGIELNEFRFVYQPKFNIRTNNIFGVEILIRWHKSNGEIVQPNEFISRLEEEKLIYFIDYYAIEECMIKISEWSVNNSINIVPIAVNLSKNTFMREDFLERLNCLIEKYKISLKHLEFEITEREALEFNIEDINRRIEEIKMLGIKISVDDFGSGNSNISFSLDVDLDIIKIDKSMIDRIGKNKKIEYILAAIMNLARDNNIELIAEGIETEEQNKFLIDNGYSFGQGYYFSKPIELSELEEKYLVKCICKN